MFPKFIVVFVLFPMLFPAMVLGQALDPNPYAEGYVYDAEKREPIPFATLKVKGWAKGVVTNRNGSFKIPKKFSALNDTIVVSSMGYDSMVILLKQVLTKESNVIFLQPRVYGLEETVVYAEKKIFFKKRLIPAQFSRKVIKEGRLRRKSKSGIINMLI